LLIRLSSRGDDPNIDPNYKIGLEAVSYDKRTSLQQYSIKYRCKKVLHPETVGISLLLRLCSKGEDPNIDSNYKIGIESNSSDKHTSLQ
jgi:hypothetical protein